MFQPPTAESKAQTAGAFLRRRSLLIALVLALALPPGLAICGDDFHAKEHELKAAFIYNFIKFTEWPTNRFTSPGTPYVIGVLSERKIVELLQSAVKGRRLAGRPITVRYVDSLSEAAACHVVFLPAEEDSRIPSLLRGLQGSSVLTIGESSVFEKAGGMITFAYEAEKLRFEINIDSVEQQNLRVSAQLQSLARKVIRRS